ncbi:MAG: efflux RND transporter periplasmic adaptor subunit [Candidatus Coatesbacteria bacterium]|nr:efflux RND transporter periplasmic adaptor subunit [Candidatus Coatesbacteria bacterium]
MQKTILAFIILLLFYAGCNGKKNRATRKPEDVKVKVKVISTETFSYQIKTSGTLQAMVDVKIAPQTSGVVTSVPVNLGDFVKKGQTLFRIDTRVASASIRLAQSQAENAMIQYQAALRNSRRQEILYRRGELSAAQWDLVQTQVDAAYSQLKATQSQINAARAQASLGTVTAPDDGYVTERNVNKGDMISPAYQAMVITDPRQMKITAGISEQDIMKISEGAEVIITSPLLKEKQYKGRVFAISMRRSDKSLNFPVEIRLDNSNLELKSGMTVYITIKGKQIENAIVLPPSYIVDRLNKWYVFIIENKTAKLREVILGERSEDKIIIESGLKTGEKIATSNIARLKDNLEIIETVE